MNEETRETPVAPEEVPPSDEPRPGPPPRSFWGALAIMVIWLSVLFVGVFSDMDFELQSAATQIRVPMVWGIALLAFLATWVVAQNAFRGD